MFTFFSCRKKVNGGLGRRAPNLNGEIGTIIENEIVSDKFLPDNNNSKSEF